MKNSRSTLAILGLLAVAAASPAAAQDEGIYLGGSGGVAQYKESCGGLTVPCDDRDAAWRLFAGYRFSRTVSAELGLADLGALTAAGFDSTGAFISASAKIRSFDLVGVLSVPVVDRLSVFGKLGVYRARVSSDFGGETNSGFTYGAGVGYDFGKLGLRLEWQRYDSVGGGSTGEDTIDVLSVGALWRF